MTTKLGLGDVLLLSIVLLILAYLVLSFYSFCFIIIVTVIAASFRLYYARSHWKRAGIPTPKGNFIFGNTFEWIMDQAHYEKRHLQELGPTVGSYVFARRDLCSTDIEFLRNICVKKFANFQNRMFFFKGSKEVAKNSIIRNAMSIVTGEDWKRIRSRVTPAFTTGKIKRVIPYFNKSTYDLVHVIERHVDQGKALPLKDLMSRLALDVIGRGGFSLEMNSFDQNSDSVFFNNARNIFNDKWFLLKASLMQFCPALAEQIENFTGIDLMEQELHRYFKAFLLNLYETRKAEHGSKNYNDILELLMEVCDEEDKQLTSQTMAEDSDIIHKELSQSSKHISKIELISQGFILLLAGYETTGSTLHLIIFILAALQDVQDKLREEIANVVGDEEEITYEHTKQFDYMNKVIYETLRMYPAAVKTNRECNNEIEINGIFFKEGDVVTIPIAAIHYNPEFYPNPGTFDPERFSAEEKAKCDPLTFAAFGYGPRNCIGMRFAEFEMRVVLAILVRKFRFKPAPNSPKLPIKFVAVQLLKPVEDLYVQAERI